VRVTDVESIRPESSEEASKSGQSADSGSGPGADNAARNTRRRVLGPEVLLVLGVSLGASAVYAAVSLAAKLTAPGGLARSTATLNASVSPRPWLDLTYQLLGVAFGVVPALLAVHLLTRDPGSAGGARGALGLDRRRPGFDLGSGAALAALIGLPGLALYVVAREFGLNALVVPARLPDVWWAVPVLVLAAAQNAVLEEVVVVGYLLTRLRQMGYGLVATVAASATLRGAYHLYQGVGAFVGNAVMGVVFALFYVRTRRVLPLVLAHTILDIVSFVGYALFRDRLGFLS
jgi:membrane protease YdiL (CAAX protease family)